MSNSQDDFLKRFQAMLASLTPDKRNQLYQALQKMEPAKRNDMMRQILERYEATVAQGQAGNAPRSTQPAQPTQSAQAAKAAAPASAPKQAANSASSASHSRPATEPQPAVQQKKREQAPSSKRPAPQQKESAKEKSSEPKHNEAKEAAHLTRSKHPADSDYDETIKPTRDDKPKKRKKNSAIFILSFLVILILAGVALVITLLDRGIIGSKKDSNLVETSAVVEEVPSETTLAGPTVTPTPEATPEPTATPTPTIVPLAPNAPNLEGLVVVIDPGHQQTTDDTQESLASWLSTTKPRCTSGYPGRVSGIAEYELTLQYSLIIKDYLEQCGATVILTRTENDVNISNQERAQIAVDSNATVFIRIHADSANDALTSGVKVFVPDSGNFTGSNSGWADRLGQLVADAEGLTYLGTTATDAYAGLNYANTIPSFQLSIGMLSNSDDETVLTTEDNTGKVAAAIAEFLADFTL